MISVIGLVVVVACLALAIGLAVFLATRKGGHPVPLAGDDDED